MQLLKIIFRLVAVIFIALAIITHNTWIAIAAVVITSINLGVLIGEKVNGKKSE